VKGPAEATVISMDESGDGEELEELSGAARGNSLVNITGARRR